MEDQSSFEAMENIQKAMSTIKGNFSQLLSNKNDMFELVELLWEASLHDEQSICIYEEENYKVKGDLLATQYSLRYTQSALLESQMKIEQFQQEWKELTESSIFPESRPFWVNGMEEPHDWVDHEEHSIQYVLKDCAKQFYENQALDFFPRKLELFLEDQSLSHGRVG